MKKMQCLFEREFHDKGSFTLLETTTPGCEWVLAGEGKATRKWDGTSVMFDGKQWFRRYDSKLGKSSFCFYPCEESPDPITKHWPGWTPVNMSNEDQYIREAIEFYLRDTKPEIGTYEACGPKINSNHENLSAHVLFAHGDSIFDDAPRTFAGLRDWLGLKQIEGLVFHHPDGRMCKIRRSDFGLPWGKRW